MLVNPEFETLSVRGLTSLRDGLTVTGAAAFRGGITSVPNANAPTSNVVIGSTAGNALQSGAANNVLIGSGAGDGITTGDRNVGIGTDALGAATSGAIENCVAVGHNALLVATGNSNTAIGHASGDAVTTGSENTLVGQSAGGAVSTGARNVAMGHVAMNTVTTGSDNVSIGTTSMQIAASTSAENVAVGRSALIRGTCSQSVAIGSNAGAYFASFQNLTAVTNSIFIGAFANPSLDNPSNCIVIGYNVQGDGSNTAVLGNSSITSTRIAGSATSKVTVDGDTMRIVGTRTPASNAAGTAGDFAFGTNSGTTYLYYCIASGNWGRVALTTGY